MSEHRTPEQADKRLEARADRPEEKLPTYQELLDEAVEETFPASDPISPTAAMKADRPVRTGMDREDWELKPDSGQEPTAGVQVVAEFDDEAAARHARDEALAHELPSARLDLPAQPLEGRPAATLTLAACDDEQRGLAMEIVRRCGAAHVAARP
jgi:hypothetical protein